VTRFAQFCRDLPPHSIWKETQENVLAVEHESYESLRNSFDPQNITVYPAVGNHESAPANYFPASGSNASVNWLYETVSEMIFTVLGLA
jgi:sphingomyelin phosphodiesterase